MKKQLIKYSRIESNRFILIPTKEGLDWLNKNPQGLKMGHKTIAFSKEKEAVGTTEVTALCVTVDTEIRALTDTNIITDNKRTFRIFTASQTTYNLTLPSYVIVEQAANKPAATDGANTSPTSK